MTETRAKVRFRIFFDFGIVADSPFCVAGSDSAATDNDLILTQDNKPFIPGSSIAGAFLSYAKKHLDGPIVNTLFGTGESDLRMSRLFFSDVVFDNTHISVRDGVALDDNKTAERYGKYDYQVCEKGANGRLRIECVVYDMDKKIPSADTVEDILISLLSAMNAGKIRFGFKKTRGLGRFVSEDKYRFRLFDFSGDGNKADIMKEYLTFCGYNSENNQCENKKYEEKKISGLSEKTETDTCAIDVPLSLVGGISIRTYSAIPNGPDFMQLTTGTGEGRQAVVPGSSWNGAIRARTLSILDEIMEAKEFSTEKKNSLRKDLLHLWGIDFDAAGNEIYIASSIVFDESVIEDAVCLNMTRNAVNRFDASTKDGALYSEASYFNGSTNLCICMTSDSGSWAMYVVWLAVKDLCNGLLAVGGQTSVGRGIFSNNEPHFSGEEKAKKAFEEILAT